MRNLWSDAEAEAAVAEGAARGIDPDLALRLYSARLLGGEPRLVRHGGGNVSVKTVARDLYGDEVEVLRVKGSGRDLSRVEPEDLPAVRLDPLRRLVEHEDLGDAEMLTIQRVALLDGAAPPPSVELLVHAFLPARFVDHTHADAVLALTDQPDGEALCAELFAGRAALVPYVRPGHGLAKAAYRAYRANPGCGGLVLLRHGVVTFGETAREAYDRMIELVSVAERRIGEGRVRVFSVTALPPGIAAAAEVAPILRGAGARAIEPQNGRYAPFVLDYRGGPEVRRFVNGKGLAERARAGAVTPDHVLRLKPWPLVVPPPEKGGLGRFAEAARAAMAAYEADYEAYVERYAKAGHAPPRPTDARPRVILVPGLGLFGLGESAAEAAVAADLAETAVSVATAAESVGRFAGLSEADMHAAEFWPPERAKLDRTDRPPLSGHVALVTGGGSGIGAATARALAGAGAAVAVLDLDREAARAVADELGPAGLGLACDVTDERAVRAAFDGVCERFGGVDIVVSNAGAAWQGTIGEVTAETLRASFELNFFAHQTVAQNGVRVMRAQGIGGCLLFNASKQAVNPGRDFGPYGLPKAATMFLVRQYALDHGREGIRANGVNADRVRSGLLTDAMIAARAEARGLSESDYMGGNLLGREVTADDVAEAFLYLALARKTTAHIVTVDGGNIEAALR